MPLCLLQGGGHLLMQGVPVAARQQLAQSISSDAVGQKNDDTAAQPVLRLHTLHIYSYSIAYSLSYREPVLYFDAADAGGTPLSLEQVLADLRLAETTTGNGISSEINAANASLETAAPVQALVSREEHPLLRRLMWMLHPCQTGAIMRLLLDQSAGSDDSSGGASSCDGSKKSWAASASATHSPSGGQLRYMMAWWSVQAQLVGMPLPSEAWNMAQVEG